MSKPHISKEDASNFADMLNWSVDQEEINHMNITVYKSIINIRKLVWTKDHKWKNYMGTGHDMNEAMTNLMKNEANGGMGPIGDEPR